MKLSIKEKKGFALNELVIVIAIIGLASALAVPSITHVVEWASDKSAKADLLKINDALELVKIELGADLVPQGKNDFQHHEAVINWINNYSSFSPLRNIDKIKIEKLKSLGSYDDFYFSEYKNQKYEKIKGKAEDPYAQNESKYKSLDSSFDKLKRNVWEDGLWVDANGTESNINSGEGKALNDVDEFLRKKRSNNAIVEKKVYYEMPGSHIWIVPERVKDITIELIGGGGSGAKAEMYEKEWGSTKKLPPISKYIERYGFSQGPPSIGTIELKGPFRLYLTPHSDPFVTSIFADINGERVNLKKNKETLIEKDTDDSYIIQIRVTAPCDHCEPWYIKGKLGSGKPRPGEHIFSLNTILVQYKDAQKYIPGHGGGSGGYAKKTFTGLKGGETVFINVGYGGLSSSGGETSARINEHEFKALGGEQGTDSTPGHGGVGIAGDINDSGNSGKSSTAGGVGGEGYSLGNNGNIRMGAGGSGSASPESQNGGSGNCGMAIITYKI